MTIPTNTQTPDTLTLVAEFNGLPINIIEHQGQRWLTAEQVGQALGYAREHARKAVCKLYDRHGDEFTDQDTFVVKLTTNPQGGNPNTRVFSATGCNLLGMFANTPRAKEFRMWAKRVLAQAAVAQSAAPTAMEARVDARLGRMEQAIETMAGHVGHMAVGMQVVLEQQDMTGKYIELLEINQRGKQRMTPEIAEQDRQLVAQGMSQSDAARLLRISRSSVQRCLSGEYTMTERMSQPYNPDIAEALAAVVQARRAEMLRRFARP